MLQNELPAYDFRAGSTLLIDKPLEWTSFDVVKKIRNITKAKTGHAGTLDPLATGLLIICTGKNTKKIEEYQGLPKEYTGTFYLGASRPSFDRETEVDQEFPIDHISEEAIYTAAKSFIGSTEQEAPIYSALKVDGTRMYEKARKGQEVKPKTRQIVIDAFDIIKIELPFVDFRIVCSKGTYIRSVAHDFGKKLDSGAYLHSLRRTKIGNFDVANALTPQAFAEEVLSIKSND